MFEFMQIATLGLIMFTLASIADSLRSIDKKMKGGV